MENADYYTSLDDFLSEECPDFYEVYKDENDEYPLPDRTIKIEGKFFRCECQGNVFRKSINDESKYRCNSCKAIYTGEK